MVAPAGGVVSRSLPRRTGGTSPRLPRAGNRRARPRRAAALDHGGDRRQSGRSHSGSDQGLAGRPSHRRSRHARRAADRGRAGWPLPGHQLRSDHPAFRDPHLGRPVPGCAVGLPTRSHFDRRTAWRPGTISPNCTGRPSCHRRPRGTNASRCSSPAAALADGGLHPRRCSSSRRRHGVDRQNVPKYLTLPVSIHKPLGITAILVLALQSA